MVDNGAHGAYILVMQKPATTKPVCDGVGTKFETFDGGKKACPVCGKSISLSYKGFALIKHQP